MGTRYNAKNTRYIQPVQRCTCTVIVTCKTVKTKENHGKYTVHCTGCTAVYTCTVYTVHVYTVQLCSCAVHTGCTDVHPCAVHYTGVQVQLYRVYTVGCFSRGRVTYWNFRNVTRPRGKPPTNQTAPFYHCVQVHTAVQRTGV